MNLSGKTILVIGGSGGLGSALVEKLHAHGATVIATASSQGSLSKIPDFVASRLVLDVLDPASLQNFVGLVNAEMPIDGLVLALGRVGFGPINATLNADAAMLMHINYQVQTWFITELLPNLTRNPEFLVAAITGVVAEKTFPGMAAYSASKAALSSWLQTLRLETRRQGGQVLDARPGHTETGLATRPLFGTAPAMPEGMTAEHVAGVIVQAIQDGKTLLTASDF